NSLCMKLQQQCSHHAPRDGETITRSVMTTLQNHARSIRAVLALGLLLLAGTGSARANAKVYERALQSTGWVIVPQDKITPMGTCWVADVKRKLVVTSRHVVK